MNNLSDPGGDLPRALTMWEVSGPRDGTPPVVVVVGISPRGLVMIQPVGGKGLTPLRLALFRKLYKPIDETNGTTS